MKPVRPLWEGREINGKRSDVLFVKDRMPKDGASKVYRMPKDGASKVYRMPKNGASKVYWMLYTENMPQKSKLHENAYVKRIKQKQGAKESDERAI